MRKKNKLYTANKYNLPLFADVDRENQNIYDGTLGSSTLETPTSNTNYYNDDSWYRDKVPGYDVLNWQKPLLHKPVNIDPSDLIIKPNTAPLKGATVPYQKIQGNPGGKKTKSGGLAGDIVPIVAEPLGGVITKPISGGLESTAGKVVGTAGTAIGAKVAMANPVAGGAIILGSKALEGGINALWGIKKNANNISRIETDIANTRANSRAMYGAASTEDVLDRWNNIGLVADFNKRHLGKEGVFKHGITRLYNSLHSKANAANYMAGIALGEGARGADNVKDSNIRRAFISAEGGPLHLSGNMGAIEYGLMSDYLTNYKNKSLGDTTKMNNYFNSIPSTMFADGGNIEIKHPGRLTALKERTGKTEAELWAEGNPDVRKMITFARNARKWKHADGGYLDNDDTLFALGGDLQTHGADWSTGLSRINAGGSHEESPYDGVQVGVDSEGTPNLVEENETIFNDYVYSTRIMADDNTKKKFHLPRKKEISFADISKKLEREAAERPNDPISQAALRSKMESLAEEQERQKAEMEEQRAREYFEQLSPEEKQAAVEQIEAQRQAAAQEQAMAEQQAMEEQAQEQGMQMSPEEAAMMQEQMAQGQPEVMEGEPMMAYGGKVNKFAGGGDTEEDDTDVDDLWPYRINNPYKLPRIQDDAVEYQGISLPRWNPRLTSERQIDPRYVDEYIESLEDAGFNDLQIDDILFSKNSRIPLDELKYYSPRTITYSRLKFPSNPEFSLERAANEREQFKTGKYKRAHAIPWGDNFYNRRNAILKSLNLHTPEDFYSWANKNNLFTRREHWDKDNTPFDDINWRAVEEEIKNKKLIDNPALMHVLEEGYDWGAYVPSANNKATIQSINTGNWEHTDGRGWLDSEDLAFKQATAGMSREQIEALTTEQLAEKMRKTEAYKNTSKWLEDENNALLYFNTLLKDLKTPEVAKKYARQFVGDDGKWKKGVTYSYEKMFGSNGKGVRETNPGTYWHSVEEANRGNNVKNFVINEDGTIEEIINDVPTDWVKDNTYTWSTDKADNTYTYYRKKALEASKTEEEKKKAEEAKKAEEEYTLEPILDPNEKYRKIGLLGPAVGLGMMAAGIGKPKMDGIDAALAVGNSGAALANYQPIGNYLKYSPLDVWANQNRMTANARAAERTIQNNAGPLGTQMAGIVANNYADQMGSGQLFRQAQEYDDALRKQVADFNRGTDQFNAEAFNRVSATNAELLNRDRQFRAGLQMQAANAKMAADADWYNSLYGNVAAGFKGLSDLGREAAQHNMIAKMAADTLFGNITDKQHIGQGVVRKVPKATKVTASKGGKLKRKKGGFTI